MRVFLDLSTDQIAELYKLMNRPVSDATDDGVFFPTGEDISQMMAASLGELYRVHEAGEQPEYFALNRGLVFYVDPELPSSIQVAINIGHIWTKDEGGDWNES